jgi:DNA-binding protein WhiA
MAAAARRRGAPFTGRVKEELASLPPGSAPVRRALLAGLLRFAASLHLGGAGGPRASLVVTTESGAVARLAYRLLADHGVHIDLRIRSRGSLNPRSAYEVVCSERVERILAETGIRSPSGRLTTGPPARLVRSREAAAGYARGAFLGRGSVSAPSRSPHLEISAPGQLAAADLARLLARLGVPAAAHARPGAKAGAGAGESWRVVLKGGEAIGRALATLGARDAYLAWEDGLIRREVRGEAVRLANADEANLRRSVAAAVAQAAVVGRVVARLGWEGLPADLAAVGRLRLAHPDATLAELGALLDPPRSKGAVLARLRRIEALDEGG